MISIDNVITGKIFNCEIKGHSLAVKWIRRTKDRTLYTSVSYLPPHNLETAIWARLVTWSRRLPRRKPRNVLIGMWWSMKENIVFTICQNNWVVHHIETVDYLCSRVSTKLSMRYPYIYIKTIFGLYIFPTIPLLNPNFCSFFKFSFT